MKILTLLTKRRVTGNAGEDAAVKYLRAHGYRILERNYVAAGKETDVIAYDKKEKTTVFCEVKTRTEGTQSAEESRPAAAVTVPKMQGLIACARAYRGLHREVGRTRFDICEVILSAGGVPLEVRHLIGAFDRDRAYPASQRKKQ